MPSDAIGTDDGQHDQALVTATDHHEASQMTTNAPMTLRNMDIDKASPLTRTR